MSEKEEKRQRLCTSGCGHIALERNRYFTGKYLTARDFGDEQEYFLSRHRLHNWLLHGWGVVCGLHVEEHEDKRCKDRWVVVRPGIALDCCGREVLIAGDTAYELPLPPELSPQQEKNGEELQTGPFLICLCYYDEHIEQVPALYAEGICDPSRQEANRIREVPRLRACSRDEYDGCDLRLMVASVDNTEAEIIKTFKEEFESKKSECAVLVVRATCDSETWTIAGYDDEGEFREKKVDGPGDELWDELKKEPINKNRIVQLATSSLGRTQYDDEKKHRCRDDCSEEIPGPAGVCIKPDCPYGECVPLALIRPKDRNKGFDSGFEIDMTGRRELPPARELLTHIVETNWHHGGEIKLSDLRPNGRMCGRLEVRFDRKLLLPKDAKGEPKGTGINEHTFVAQYRSVQRNLEFLPRLDNKPPFIDPDDPCLAVFEIDPNVLGEAYNIANTDVYVSLNCDFILDCHKKAIDGEHLRGCLPSGNGTEGGTFQSWFRVVADGAAQETY